MAKKAATPEVLDMALVDVSAEDQKLVADAGMAIRTFFSGLAAFFGTARDLEVTAKANLEKAKTLKAPTNGDEDAVIVEFVRDVAAHNKQVEDHWGITAIVSGFHRKLTAKRTLATSADEEARKIGTGLHNTYTEAERRRAAAETERQRRENEQRALDEQNAKAAALEAEAVAREEASAGLSEREQMFVDLYVLNGNVLQAAQRAGYKDAMKQAARLITLPKIAAAIKAKQEAMTLRQQATAERAKPVEVETVQVKADTNTRGDTTTWSGEVLDAQALVEAFRSGKYGIPADVLTVNAVKLNEYARSLHERMDLWPGVRANKKTGIR